MNRLSKPRSSTCRANVLIPRARSGPSPSQMYDGRNTPNRPTSAMCYLQLVAASAAAILRLSLLEEGPGALQHVVAGEDPIRCIQLRGQSGRDVDVRRQRDETLRLTHGHGAARGDLHADLVRGAHGLSGRNDAVDQADALGLLGVDDAPGEDQLA